MASRNVDTERQLRALLATATEGHFTEEHYKQVIDILSAHAANSDLAYPTAALHTVKLSLQHHPTDPCSPPPGLLPSGLLNIIFTLSSRYDAQFVAESARSGPSGEVFSEIPLDMLGFIETAVDMLDTLLQAPLNFCLSSQQQGGTPDESARQIQPWRPLLLELYENNTKVLRSGLHFGMSACCALERTGGAIDLLNAWQRMALEVFHKGGQATVSSARLVPGQAAMLAQGSIKMLRWVLYDKGPLLDRDRCTVVPLQDPCNPTKFDYFQHNATQNIIVMLENDAAAFLLPRGGWPWCMLDLLPLMDSSSCAMLLASTAALQSLGRPLLAFAADPQLWQQGAYAYHVQLLDDLCRWAGSLLGTKAMQKLVQQLVQPVTAALDTLLEQVPPDERKGVAYLVETSIRVMTHLAVTDHGRSHMASSGCLPRWLELAPRWRRQPAVLQRLLVLAIAPFVAFSDAKHASSCLRLLKYLRYEELPGANLLQAFHCKPAPTPLHMQVASSRAVAALAALMEADMDHISRSVLLDLLDGPISSHDPAAVKPLVNTLLAYSKPISTQQQPLQHPGNDLLAYMGASAQSGQQTTECTLGANQLRALTLVCCYYRQETTAAATGGLQVVLAYLAEWLEMLQEDERAAAAGGRACWECGMAAQIVFNMANNHPVVAPFREQRHLLLRMCGLLSHAPAVCDPVLVKSSTMVTGLAAAFASVMDKVWEPRGMLPWEQVEAADSSKGLPACLARPRALAAVVQHLEFLASHVSAEGMVASSTVEILLLSAVAVIRMDGIVSCCWAPSGEQGRACRVVLEAREAVWGLFKFITCTMPQFSGLVSAAWLEFLHRQLQQDEWPELQRLAKEVLVKQLGEEVVRRAVEHVSTARLPCDQYRQQFGRVFDEAASQIARRLAVQAVGDKHSEQKLAGSSKEGAECSSRGSSRGHGGGLCAFGSGAGGTIGGTGTAGSVPGSGAGGSSASSSGAAGSAPGSGAGGGKGVAASPGARSVVSRSGSNISEGDDGTGSGYHGTAGVSGCSVCHAQPEEPFLCSRCQAVQYCSKECQRVDWKQHKRMCSQPK